MDEFYRITNPRKSREITVTNTDVNGNTTQETRTIHDSTLVQGKEAGWENARAFNQAIANRGDGAAYVYKKDDGNYTSNIFDIPSTVKLDSKTGKITITAPQSVLDSSDFDKMYGDGSILKQLSATYQADPNAKVKTSDGRELTIQQMVNEWDKGIKDLSTEVHNNILRRDALAAYDERAKDFNDDQTRIASYSAVNQGDVKASDTDRQYIPKWLLNSEKGSKIANLPSWDAESGTVERKDLLTWWSLGNFSRDEMIELKGKAEVNLQWGSWSDEDQYKADDVDENGNVIGDTMEDNLSSKTEMAKTISFLRFIVAQDPEGNIFEKAGSAIESIGVNFAMNFAEAATGTLAVIETGAAFLTDNLDTWKSFTNLDQAMKDSTAYYNEAMSLASDSAVAIGQIAGIGGQITGHLALSWATGKVAGWTGQAIGSAKNAIAAARTDAAIQPLTSVASTLFKGGAIGIEEYAQMANSLSAGSKFLTSALATSGKLAKVFNQAVSIARAIKQTPLIGSALDLLGDALMDATISNPEAMRTLLKHVKTGEVSKEDYNYAMEQFGQSLKGWLVFRSAGVALKGALTKTTLGKAVNLKVSQFLTKLDNWAYDVDQGFKAKILGKSVIENLEDKLGDFVTEEARNSAKYRRLQSKLSTAKNNAILRQFKETFASGKNWDTVLDKMQKNGLIEDTSELKGLKKYITEATAIQNNIKAWNNAIDNMRKGVTLKYMELMDPTLNPLTAATNDAIVDWVADYQKTEGKVKGLTYDKKHTTMSVEASNYLGYSLAAEREAVRANNMELSAEVRAKAAKNLELANAKVKEMSEILGVDATSKLDEALPLYRNEYEALHALASSPENGYVNTIQLNEFEDMDLWGEDGGYVRTQRVMEDSGVRMTSETGDRLTRPVVETQFREFTTNRDYVDFEQTRSAYRSSIAEAAYQKSLLQTYMLNGQSTVQTYISPEETERVRKLGQVKLEYEKQAAEIANTAQAQFNLRSSKRGKNLTDAQYNKAVYGLGFDETQDIILNYADTTGWRGETLVDGYTGAAITNLDVEQRANYWSMFQDNLNDSAKSFLEARGITSIDDLDRVVRNEGTDFINGLNQAYIYGDDGLRASEAMKNIARNKYNSRADVIKDLKLAKTKETLGLYDDQLGKNFGNDVTNGMVDYADDWIDDAVAKSDEQWAHKKLATERASILGAEEDLTREYTVLEAINDNPKYKDAAYKKIDAELKTKYGKTITADDLEKLQDEAHRVFDATLESRIDTTKAALLEKTTDEALRRNVFDEVSKLKQDIIDAKKGIGRSVRKQGETGNLILATDEQGRQVVYSVDPILADIYNRKQQVSAREASFLAKANYAMSKMFRLGTTTVNLTSFGNQFFKDTGNGIVVGGMWDTLKNNADNFRDIYGDDVIEQLQAFSPYEATSVMALAESQGISIEEALRKRELRRAEIISDTSAEYEAYREFREKIYGGEDNKLNVLQKMDNAVQSATEAIDKRINGIRERYIRKNVYMSNLNDALSNGYTIKQARTTAEFAARNATTNFGRTLYHLQNISESTPYFAAAINGTKSFWRMFELDPVGITGRFMGGFVLPAMYLTAQSLSNEQDAKIYKNLPEYEREGSLTFVTNGQVFQIPIPEQLTSLVSPFRQFVEYLHGANKDTFWKLAANDLLGLSPIELQGFSSVDFNSITNDPTPLDMIGRGFSRLFSQVAPVPLKSAYMGFTGIDPYTGKQIQSTTNVYYDETTESTQVMDYTQNMFARSVAALFGSDNPKIIEKVTSSIIGNTGVDVLGVIFGAVAALKGEDPYSGKEYTGGDFWESTLSQAADRATAPITGPNYDQVSSMWSSAIRELNAKKQAILNSKEVKAISDKLSTETDPEKRKKLVAQRQNYKDEFDNDVKNTITNLLEKYGGTFDRHKYGAVLQLLNFNTETTWANASAYSQELHSDLFYEGRNQAIQTMVDMGVSGVNDTSMFGYYTTNLDGEVVLKYNSPLAILNARNQWYNRYDIDSAAVKSTLEASIPNLNQERSDMWAKVKAAKGYDAKDKIREEWNEKILGGIMPYIADLSTDQILNNDDVINYLEGYIQVPSWYEKVNNRYVSSGYDAKTGTYKLDKNKAFIESYLRTVLEKR